MCFFVASPGAPASPAGPIEDDGSLTLISMASDHQTIHRVQLGGRAWDVGDVGWPRKARKNHREMVVSPGKVREFMKFIADL